MTSTDPNKPSTPDSAPAAAEVVYTDDKGNEKTMKRSDRSGVLEGKIEKRPGGFAVKHPDGTESSYTLHGPEEVPGSVDEIDKDKRPEEEAK